MNRPKAIADILRETKMMKAAAAAKVAELAGMDPESMPGAEHDKPAPKDAQEPDPQVADGTMGPDSARSAEGAGDDRPITAGSLFEADEAVLNPEKKPMESADANAKVAEYSKLGNEFLRMAQDFIKEKTASAKSAAPSATPAKATAPAKAAAIPDVTKAGEGLNIEFSQDILTKLACYMLAEEEGAALAERVLTKVAGAESASRTMDYLAKQAAYAEQADAYQRGYNARMAQFAAVKRAADEEAMGEAAGAAAADAALADAAGADAEAAGAAAADADIAEAAGAADAEAELANAAEEAGADLGDTVSPEEVEAALAEGVQSGEIDEATAQAIQSEVLGDAGAGIEDMPVEDMIQGLAEGVQSGEIDMDTAADVLDVLIGDGEGEGDDAGMGDEGGDAMAEAEAAGAADADADIAAAAKEAAARQKQAAARGILARLVAKGRAKR